MHKDILGCETSVVQYKLATYARTLLICVLQSCANSTLKTSVLQRPLKAVPAALLSRLYRGSAKLHTACTAT